MDIASRFVEEFDAEASVAGDDPDLLPMRLAGAAATVLAVDGVGLSIHGGAGPADSPGGQQRRQPGGLPRIDRITDVYSAVSITSMLPFGGEDRAAYASPPRLVRADGTEPFDTTSGDEAVVEHPEVGEVVWRDDGGVTCRRWNWRQCTRTGITTATTSAVFILDVLDPLTDDDAHAAADALTGGLLALSPDAHW